MSGKLGVAQLVAKELKDTGTAGVNEFTLNGLASGGVRQSDQLDLGEGFHPGWYVIFGVVQYASAVSVGVVSDVYLGWSDGTLRDANLGASDAAAAANDLDSLHHVLSIPAQETTQDTNMVASARIFIPTRYVIAVLHNQGGQALTATNDVSKISLIPIPTIQMPTRT